MVPALLVGFRFRQPGYKCGISRVAAIFPETRIEGTKHDT